MFHESHDGADLSFGIEVERDDHGTVVALHGELDFSVAPLLEGVLSHEPRPGLDIVFDMGGVRFVDGAGIGCMASVAARARAAGGGAAVESPPVMAARVIRLLGLEDLMGLAPGSSRTDSGRAAKMTPVRSSAAAAARHRESGRGRSALKSSGREAPRRASRRTVPVVASP